MNFRPFINWPYAYSMPMAQYPVYRDYQMPVIPQVTKPAESFYVHIKDAEREEAPLCVRSYRRPQFNKSDMEQRHQKAKDLREKQLKQRVERLSARSAYVKRLNTAFYAHRNLSWQRLREHIAQDMKQHIQRQQQRIMERVESLRVHNGQVQNRYEILNYGNYLQHIAQQHVVARRKRKGIF